VACGRDFIRGYGTILNIGLVRATASFKDANILGVYLSAIAPLVFGLTLYYFKGLKKIVFYAASALVLTGICLTYSRPTLLATYVVLFLFALVKKSRILLAILVAFTIAAPFIAPRPVKEWAKKVEYHPIRFMCNDDRIAIFRNSMNMIRAHPVIGIGANNFMKNYKEYKEHPEYRNEVTSDFCFAHNNFLQLAAELGLVGLAIFLWLLYRLFKESVRIYRLLDDRFFKIVSLSLIACLIAFQVNGLTETSFFSSRVAMIFWIIAGISLSLRRFCRA
jgi:putative inorganic carbon (HCO3(-)) transporter